MSVMGMPSTFHVVWPESVPLPMNPDCCPDSDPPTFTRSVMMPGTDCITTHGSRAVGTSCSSCKDTVVAVVSFFVSMTGDSAVTFTVSWAPATDIWTFNGIATPAATGTFVLRYSLNPCRLAVSW